MPIIGTVCANNMGGRSCPYQYLQHCNSHFICKNVILKEYCEYRVLELKRFIFSFVFWFSSKLHGEVMWERIALRPCCSWSQIFLRNLLYRCSWNTHNHISCFARGVPSKNDNKDMLLCLCARAPFLLALSSPKREFMMSQP